MDIGVGRYVPAADSHGAPPDGVQLPDGFPFLVDRGTGEIIEPVFRYLYAKVVHTRTFTVQSAVGAADNLRLWWGYLHHRGCSWDRATGLDIDAYCRGLGRVVSPRTRKKLAEATIRQRRTHPLDLYRWTNKRGLTRLDPKSLNSDEYPVVGEVRPPKLKVLTYEQWAALRSVLGPLPSDPGCEPRTRACRDRLIWEIVLHTGMRLNEVLGLTVHQIRDMAASLPVTDEELFAARTTQLTTVKGGPVRARDAIVPQWLLKELLRYTEGEGCERALAAEAHVAKAKARGASRPREPDALFLNHAWARRAPGAALQPKNLERICAEAMVAAGLFRTVLVADPDTGERIEKTLALFSIHDGRHTAAVWRYMAERANGNAAPWHPVMVMLGHRDETTTKRVYLRVTNTFEAQVSDSALRFFRGLRPTETDVGADESDI